MPPDTWSSSATPRQARCRFCWNMFCALLAAVQGHAAAYIRSFVQVTAVQDRCGSGSVETGGRDTGTHQMTADAVLGADSLGCRGTAAACILL